METRPASAALTPPPPGTRLGDFVLQEEIGRGGMGVVYRAWQESLEREVALKLLRDSALTEPSMAERFRVEARAAAALQHPGIVRVYESGTADGVLYYAMDFVEGRTVAEIVKEKGPLDPARAATLTAEMADAMQHAHDFGVVHRDLKPSNVIEDLSGHARVMDFGLARRDGGDSLTVTGDVLGTPGYMSPEQAAGNREASGAPAVDVFGLGAVLYYMLTGRAPFEGDGPTDALRRASDGAVISPRRLSARTPRDLETICLKCLRRVPGERYASPRELAADLRRYLAGDSVRARPVSTIRSGRDWLRRRPRVAALLLIALAALVAGGIWIRHQWLYAWKHEVVCAFAVRTVSGLEPVRELKAAEWGQRQSSTRLIRQGTRGPVVRVESVAGDGRIIPGGVAPPFFEVASALPRHRLPVRAELEYDSAGRLSEETLYDSAGGITGRTRLIYPKGDGSGSMTARVDYFDAAAAPLTGGTSTFSGRLHADEDGEWVRLEFLDSAGHPSTADKGVYGRRFIRPGKSVSRVLEYLDQDGQLMNNSDGVARITEIFSGDMKRREAGTYDREGRPVSLHGYHLAVEKFSDAGEVLERRHFKEDGVTPAPSSRTTERGASRVSYTYGERGRIREILADGFDAAATGFAVKKETRAWPDNGGVLYSSATEFFDAASQPVRYRSGYLTVRQEDDYFNRALRIAYEGYDPAAQGYWAEDIANTWGEGLRPVRVQWSFRQQDGRAARHPKGYTHSDEEYDVRGRLLKITRTGFDGSGGYEKRVVTIRYESDTSPKESGRLNEYFDAAGQRVEPAK